jgi:iron complex outermembrane receptor protein
VNGDNNDKYIYMKPAPDYLIGLSALSIIKNFDLSASARASIGNYVYNQVAREHRMIRYIKSGTGKISRLSLAKPIL